MDGHATNHVLLPVHVEHLDKETGLWCNTCMLGSGVRVWFTVTCGDSMVLRSQNICTECQGRHVV